MKAITLKIGELFDYVESHKQLKDEIFEPKFSIKIKDEHNNWIPVSGLIYKTAPIHELTFSDGSILKAADLHPLSIEPQHELTRFIKDFEPEDDFSYTTKTVVSNREIGEDTVYGIQVESPTHLYQTTDGLIHHNTYTCKRAAERGIARNPKGYQLKIASGDVGAAPSDVLFLLWKYREGYVLILDDADGMLKSRSQTTANILKGALDPDVKPVAAGGYAVRKLIQNKIDADKELNPSGLSKKEQLKLAKEKRKEEGVETERQAKIEQAEERAEKARQAIADANIGDEVIEVTPTPATPKKPTLSAPKNPAAPGGKLVWSWDGVNPGKYVRESHLRELQEEPDEFESPLTLEQKEEVSTFDIPDEFVFRSSVIFITNLEFEDINSAVRDRCLPATIKLTREEFMVRLETVLGTLCKENQELSSLSQETLDWAKKNAYSMLKALVEAEKEKRPLFKDKIAININRQLTFRSIDDLVSIFLNVAKTLERIKPGFKEVTDLNERAKLMTYQFAREATEYLATKSSA